MGLFALRKVDPSSVSLSHGEASMSGPPDRSIAQLIRDRFNGRKRRQANLSRSSLATAIGSIDSSNRASSRTIEQAYSIRRDDDVDRTYRTSHQLGTHRTSSDAVTVTLAHRLNELAVAHKEGLLNDDDYRVLRQNLFSSFATHSAPPVEVPVVKSVEPVAFQFPPASRSDCVAVSSARAPSLLTQTTSRSSISTLFHRLRRKTSQDRGLDEQDRMSVLSSVPRTPLSPALSPNARELRRQPSSVSLKTTRSRHIPPDLRSVSSRRSIRSVAAASDTGGMSRGSTRSLRGNDPPPSSFNAKSLSSQLLALDSSGDRLRSASDIRAAIRAVEAEQQNVVASLSLYPQTQLDPRPSNYIQSLISQSGVPGDRISVPGKKRASKCSVSDPSSSTPILNSSERWLVNQGFEMPDIHQHLGANVEDARTDELGRRRVEISVRYQQRLDYLRARLKGAEIHERLTRN